jgi:hypothetical protein
MAYCDCASARDVNDLERTVSSLERQVRDGVGWDGHESDLRPCSGGVRARVGIPLAAATSSTTPALKRASRTQTTMVALLACVTGAQGTALALRFGATVELRCSSCLGVTERRGPFRSNPRMWLCRSCRAVLADGPLPVARPSVPRRTSKTATSLVASVKRR